MTTKYTPTPWIYIEDKEFDVFEKVQRLVGKDQISPGVMFDESADYPEGNGNRRLVLAAVNSYAKHCGERAVECAEEDLLGQALDVLEGLHERLERFNATLTTAGDRAWISSEARSARDVLTKAGRKS